MEDKIRRESKCLMERLFKEKDEKGIGAIPCSAMGPILIEMGVPTYDEEELTEMINELKKDSSFVAVNKTTNKFEVKRCQNTLDFPSALFVAVHFLMKNEKKANRSFGFSGRGLIKLDDLGGGPLAPVKSSAKRMY